MNLNKNSTPRYIFILSGWGVVSSPAFSNAIQGFNLFYWMIAGYNSIDFLIALLLSRTAVEILFYLFSCFKSYFFLFLVVPNHNNNKVLPLFVSSTFILYKILQYFTGTACRRFRISFYNTLWPWDHSVL